MVEVDPWKKRARKPFGDMFFDFDRMEEMMDQLMRGMFTGPQNLEKRDRKPLLFGFSMKMGPDGKPMIEEFGNVKPADGRLEMKDAREPLVDVIREKDEVVVTAEMPGVEKKDMTLKTDKGKLTISVDTADRKFYKEIELEKDVQPKTAKAVFKNGVLEVRLKRKRSLLPKRGKEIKIE